MARWSFATLVLLFAAPAFASSPTIEEIRAKSREACGFEAFQKLPDGIVLEGKAEFLGIPGTFRLRFAPSGRYVRVISAKGEHAVGFDGTARWGRNFSGPVRLLEMEEADRDRFLFGVLCQRWLVEDSFKVAVDEQNTTPTRVCLALRHPDAGVEARLFVNRATWCPESLETPGANSKRVIEFSDYREIAGVRFPARVAIGSTGGQMVNAERGREFRSGDKDSFVAPAVGLGAKFDQAAPARLDAKLLEKRILLVKPKINGQDVPWFVLDTGNGALTLLTAAIADRLDLPTFGGTTAIGAGAVKTRFRQADRFTLGPAEVADMVFLELPQEFADLVRRRSGVEIAGVLGWDFLFRAVVEIDYEAGVVNVHDPLNHRLPAGTTWEPIHFNSRMPCVKGTFEGKHEGLFMFDTGHQSRLTMHAPAVRRLDLLKDRETTTRTFAGIGGEEVVRLGTASEFRVLGRSNKSMNVGLATESSGLSSDPYTLGTFGLAALGPGTVVFDYPKRRIAFIPKP
jgi:hypothetical protein